MASIGNVSVGTAPSRSQEIIAEASKTVPVKDARGRAIEVRRPNNVTRRNARKAMSAESQTKMALMAEAMLAFLVVSIEGAPVLPPDNETKVEALQDRLGDDGVDAVAEALEIMFPKKKDGDDDVAEAKNS